MGFTACTGAQGGPGHIVWEAGIILSHYFVSHPGKCYCKSFGAPWCTLCHTCIQCSVVGLAWASSRSRTCSSQDSYVQLLGVGSVSACAGMTDLVRGKQVLELGCGTGVLGITLACLGADVTLTDIAAIVPHTKYNIQCHQQLIQSGQGKATEAALDWNSPSSSQSILAKQYDLLVGADLIYAVKDISPLTDTLQQLWQHSSDCPLIIAHKIRSLPVTNQFLAQLRQVGCCLHEAETDGAVCIYNS
jgi:2-polyprenyl-3-methyl-5-hydroxy-6-metoxy-1,4-benzoquinol methylase